MSVNVPGKTIKNEISERYFHTPDMSLDQWLANFLWKGQDSKYFWLVGQKSLSYLPNCRSSHRQYVSE